MILYHLEMHVVDFKLGSGLLSFVTLRPRIECHGLKRFGDLRFGAIKDDEVARVATGDGQRHRIN